MPHAQVADQQSVSALLQLVKALRESSQTLHAVYMLQLSGQCVAFRKAIKLNLRLRIEQRVKAFKVVVPGHHNHAPQNGVERRGCHEEMLGRDALPHQRGPSDLRYLLLRGKTPGQVARAEQQTDNIGHLTSRPATDCQRPDNANQQRQRVQGINDEDAANAKRVVGERQRQLSAIDRHRVEQRVRHQHQPERQPPTPQQAPFAVQSSNHRGQRQG